MHADEGSNATALAAIIRDMMFTFPQRRLSRALATSDYSVHSYRFAPPLHTLLGLLFGDCHCNALPFIFSKADAAGRTSGDVAAAASIEKLTGVHGLHQLLGARQHRRCRVLMPRLSFLLS